MVLYRNKDGATVTFWKAVLIFILKILYISFFYVIQFSLFQNNLKGGGGSGVRRLACQRPWSCGKKWPLLPAQVSHLININTHPAMRSLLSHNYAGQAFACIRILSLPRYIISPCLTPSFDRRDYVWWTILITMRPIMLIQFVVAPGFMACLDLELIVKQWVIKTFGSISWTGKRSYPKVTIYEGQQHTNGHKSRRNSNRQFQCPSDPSLHATQTEIGRCISQLYIVMCCRFQPTPF